MTADELVSWLDAQITDTERSIKAHVDSSESWRSGTPTYWKALERAGQFKRTTISEREGLAQIDCRIADKHRKTLQILVALKTRLTPKPTADELAEKAGLRWGESHRLNAHGDIDPKGRIVCIPVKALWPSEHGEDNCVDLGSLFWFDDDDATYEPEELVHTQGQVEAILAKMREVKGG